LQPSLLANSSFVAKLTPAGGGFGIDFSTFLGWQGDSILATAPAEGGVWFAGLKNNGPWLGRIALTPAPPAHPGTPEIRSVYNAASFRLEDIVCPGEIVTILGTDLDGATVTVGDLPAQVFYAGAGQINFRVPPEIPKTGVRIVVRRGDRSSAPRPVEVLDSVYGVFGVYHSSDFRPVTAENPARFGESVTLLGTGITPPLWMMTIDYRLELKPDWFGDAPGYPGVQQINLRLPTEAELLTDGRVRQHPIVVGNSNVVRIYIQ
jgi:hypothetical protein